ncbi:MAG: radical SAM protein [Bacteroidaceae bacterium]|nr:radical SAM protein [Bacteroidaceae bacterium]
MKQNALNTNNIYVIPVGRYFDADDSKCLLVYAPLANLFFLSTPDEVERLEALAKESKHDDATLQRLMSQSVSSGLNPEVSEDTFCTLHLLLNEKCNFKCKYCYSASGRSTAELDMKQITPMLDFFLSEKRKAVKNRTIMFMGGGEPALSWKILKEATLYAEKVADKNNTMPHFAITTNGSILHDEMIAFFKEHNFTVQLSFEVLPDVQNEQRGFYDTVAANVVKLTEAGVGNYVRSTITEKNVDRIPEMVRYCHKHFPLVKKLSCQQVVDPTYFTSTDIVKDFFGRYYKSFKEGDMLARQLGITLRSSSSHLINYSKRERFCYNLVCLTPYGTLTVCPDVSSPNEMDYEDAVFGAVSGPDVEINTEKLRSITSGSIHTIDKCRGCYARWNCGSGCPSSRRVYTPEIFDAICDHYRHMLTDNLVNALASQHMQATGKNLFTEISAKLK